MKKPLLFTLLCALSISGRLEQATAAEKKNDVPPGKEFIYKQTAGKPQTLEVYFPKDHDPAKAKVPCVLLFHGGKLARTWEFVEDIESYREHFGQMHTRKT